tara:strand:+ start:1271 stop:1783 length:513 start_codon:yes stop_codon:yes gene_type:complete
LDSKRVFFVASLIGIQFFSGVAFAEEPRASNFLGLSIGFYNVLDGDQQSQDIRLEYRHGTAFFEKLPVKPWVGILGTTDGSFWGGGGLYYDFTLNERWAVTPSLGVGLYTDGSNDVDLGHPIEFRSQIEVSYKLRNEDKLALSFSHFSNAGLGDTNTGVESLSLHYFKSL